MYCDAEIGWNLGANEVVSRRIVDVEPETARKTSGIAQNDGKRSLSDFGERLAGVISRSASDVTV
jgi:hypothetical protein